jgi:hypothetical protein
VLRLPFVRHSVDARLLLLSLVLLALVVLLLATMVFSSGDTLAKPIGSSWLRSKDPGRCSSVLLANAWAGFYGAQNVSPMCPRLRSVEFRLAAPSI